jgi:hypothetical protein
LIYGRLVNMRAAPVLATTAAPPMTRRAHVTTNAVTRFFEDLFMLSFLLQGLKTGRLKNLGFGGLAELTAESRAECGMPAQK